MSAPKEPLEKDPQLEKEEEGEEEQSQQPQSEKRGAPSDEGGVGPSVGLRKRERHLDDEERVFSHNAWDDVEWDEEQEQRALAAVDKNSKNPVSEEDKGQ